MIDAHHATNAAFAVSYPARRVLVLAETPAARLAAGQAVEALGAGVTATCPIVGAAERLAGGPQSSAILVEAEGVAADALLPVLDALTAAAEAGRPSVIVVPRPLLDLAAARAAHRLIDILCEPGPFDRTAALGIALATPPGRLNDSGGEAGSVQLRQLSEEVGRIARTLATLSSETNGRAALRGSALLEGILPGNGGPAPREIEASTIRAIIRARRLRDQYFDRDLFADPAWDILLDLAAARLERTPVAVSSLCIAAAVPPTTALRWIKTLTDAGLLVRAADTRDGRRVFIELSEPAAAGMLAYLQAAAKLSMWLV